MQFTAYNIFHQIVLDWVIGNKLGEIKYKYYLIFIVNFYAS